MKLRYWVLWAFASWVLFVVLPSPWYRIGLGMFSFAVSWAVINLISFVDRASSNEKKLEQSMYQALNNSEKISDTWLTTGFGIPQPVVQAVLRKWESARLVVRCDPPADASDTTDGNWYNITAVGKSPWASSTKTRQWTRDEDPRK